MSYESRYEKLFREMGIELSVEDGCSADTIVDCEERLGSRLPEALRDYYAKVGKHPINRAHNRLVDLSELNFLGNYLAFLEENQNIALWGVPRTGLDEVDPIVWQGENSTPVVWQSEGLPFSAFIETNLYWQAACGGLEFAGTATELDARVVETIEQHWPNVKSHNKMRFFVKPGQVLVLNDEGAGVFSLLAAGTTLEQFAVIDETLCIEWDWSILDELDGEDDDEDDEQ